MSTEISVAICTYRRPARLRRSLQSLCAQAINPERYEILVVDNALDAQTAAVVEDCRKDYPRSTVRLLREPAVGLSHARNRALSDAHGPYLAFLDDDAWAPEAWLAMALAVIRQCGYPAALGGPVQPFFTTAPPRWFCAEYELRTWGQVRRLLGRGESFSGPNMIWRVDRLRALGGFDPALGVRGEWLFLGEETAAFARLLDQVDDAAAVYEPQMVVFHEAPAEKTSILYRLRRDFVAGQLHVRRGGFDGIVTRLQEVVRSVSAIAGHSLLALMRVYRYRHWQNWLVEEGASVARNVGSLLAILGWWVPVKQAR